jgi:hypothetical protein
MAAVPMTAKAKDTSNDQKKQAAKRVQRPVQAGFQFSDSSADNFNGSKTTVASKVEQDEAFKGVQATHLETTPQRNKVAKNNKLYFEDEVDFEDVDWKILSPVMRSPS